MGILRRVNSLPNGLEEMPDATWPQDKYQPDDLQSDLQSITSESSVADILKLMQAKRGTRGATVHGSNVWELMKAAAAAKENARLDDIRLEELKQPPANDFQQCSDDMWTWIAVHESDDATADEMDTADVLATPPNLDSDAMWCWNAPPAPLSDDDQWWMWRWEAKDPDEASGARSGCAKVECVPVVVSYLLLNESDKGKLPESDEMWDWSAALPPSHEKKAALIWDWAWQRPEEEEPETSVQLSSRASLLWDWSWRRDALDEADEKRRAKQRSAEAKALAEEERAEVAKAADLWDWSALRQDEAMPQYARETLMWDWTWQRDEDGAAAVHTALRAAATGVSLA